MLTETQDYRQTINLNKYQSDFVQSASMYPCLQAGWGTGKTLAGILKAIELTEESPFNLGAIIRNEATDLRDSTMKDFELYTGLKVGKGSREITYENGSTIMFRHGKDLDALKNLNLGWFLIEQGDDFPDAQSFFYLQGRLRRRGVRRHCGMVIANANGHDWIWDLWRTQKPEGYQLFEACTWDNAHNLPTAYLNSLKVLETQSPSIYRRFVLNDCEEESGVDYLLSRKSVEECYNLGFVPVGGELIACDPARYGDCKTVITILKRVDEYHFKQVHHEAHGSEWFAGTKAGIMKTAGRLAELRKSRPIETIIVDGVGVGGGIVDRLREVSEEEKTNWNVIDYNGGESALDSEKFVNKRAEDTFHCKDLILNKQIELMKIEDQARQLATLPYSVRSNGKKYILSKEEFRNKKLPSPDHSDCLVMAASFINQIPDIEKEVKPDSAKEFWGRVKEDRQRFAEAEQEGVFRSV